MFHHFHKESPYSFAVHSGFEDALKLWDRMLPETHHLRQADLKSLEVSEPDDLMFRYVTVYEKENIIGLLYLQILKFNSKHYQQSISDRPFFRIFSSCMLENNANILICGNLFRSEFPGYYFSGSIDSERIFDILLSYRKQNERELNICGILLKDGESNLNHDYCGTYRFKPFKKDLSMEISIREDWKSMEDYLEALSRKYKSRAVKIIKSKETLELKELNIDEIRSNSERIRELYLGIVKKQKFSLGVLNPDYFYQMKLNNPEGFKVFGYYFEGKLIAFSSRILTDHLKCTELHYIGIDNKYNSKFNLYFNILFDGIQDAITQGYKVVKMGRTAHEAKASAGAVAVENYNYFWLQAGFIRMMVNFLGKWYEENLGDEWMQRNPFRSIPGKVANNLSVQIAETPHSRSRQRVVNRS